MVKELTKFFRFAEFLGKKEKKWDLFWEKNQTLRVEIEDGIKKFFSGEDQGFGIRVLKNKKCGFAFSSGFPEKNVNKIFKKAFFSTKFLTSSESKDIPEIERQLLISRSQKFKNFFVPERVEKDKIFQILENIINSAISYDKKIFKVPRVIFEKINEEVFLENFSSSGVSYSKNVYEIFVQAVARDENDICGASEIYFSSSLNKLEPEKIGQAVAQKALRKLKAEQIKSGKYQVVFEPATGAQIISILAGALSGEEVLKGRSFLKEKLNKKIASCKFNLVDDGFLKNGPGSLPFDDEGIPTEKKFLFFKGVLKNYYHSLYSARYFKVNPTGNSIRENYSNEPKAHPTNLYLESKGGSLKSLISLVKKGILITELYGLHTADKVSGSFSLGAEGQLIEKGKIVKPLKHFVISGNLKDLIRNVVEVAGEVKFFPFYGSIGSPYFLVEEMIVSGS